MLLTFTGLVIFGVVFAFSVSNTKYHIFCSGLYFSKSDLGVDVLVNVVFKLTSTV